MHLERHPGAAETEGGRLDGAAGAGESLRASVSGKAHQQSNVAVQRGDTEETGWKAPGR